MKGSFNFKNVSKEDQKKIKDYCLLIDQERYKQMDFGPELLAKLGTQFTNDILPKLYRLQMNVEKDLPVIVKYLYVILCFLISFGVALPLMTKIYSLSPFFDAVAIAMVVSICLYIMTSFYRFLKNEIKI